MWKKKWRFGLPNAWKNGGYEEMNLESGSYGFQDALEGRLVN